MRKAVLSCLVIALLAGGCTSPSVTEETQNWAKGMLKVGSEELTIQHAYVEDGDNYVLLMLTDRPVDEDDQIHGAWVLAEAKEVSGITVSLGKETMAVGGRLDLVFHPAFDGMAKYFSDAAQMEVTTFDDEVLEGRLHLDEPEGPEENPYTFDITFSVAYGVKEELVPWKVKVTGADSDEGKAYAAFVTAVMALDVDGAMRWSAAERSAALEDEDAVELLDGARSMMPKKISIVSVDTDGDTSTLAVEGSVDDLPGTGTVSLEKEDGEWKVAQQSWDFK